MYKTLACSEGVVNFGGDFAPRSDASPHQGQGWGYALRHFNARVSFEYILQIVQSIQSNS
jgi:hypothetical protein